MTTGTKSSKSSVVLTTLNIIGLFLVSGRHLPVFIAPDFVRNFCACTLWPEMVGVLVLLAAFVVGFFVETSVVGRFLPGVIAASLLLLGPWLLSAELRAVTWINDGRPSSAFINPFAGMVLIAEPGDFDPKMGRVYFVYRRDPLSFLDGEARYNNAHLLVFDPNHLMNPIDLERDAAFTVINENWYRFESPD